MGIGESAGLCAAAFWALSSLIFSRVLMTAWELNFWKNVVASLIFLVHVFVVKSVLQTPFFEAPLESWCWLGASSLVGIVVGDTVYLRSLQILGPRRALVVATSSPIFGVLIGFFVMADEINAWLLLGIGITMLGVTVVVTDKKAKIESPNVFPGNFLEGITLGLAGAFCQAFAIALAKFGMSHGCEAVESSFIRIFVAMIASIFLMALFPKRFSQTGIPPDGNPDQRATSAITDQGRPGETKSPDVQRSIFSPILDFQTMKYFIPAAMIGSWLGIWFFQVAQQYSDIAVVTTLASTCPIFAIPLIWFFQGHTISRIGIVGTAIAVGGVVVVINCTVSA